MWAKHKFINIVRLFGGMNCVDTPDILTQKGQGTYALNVYSDPFGSVSKLFGRSAHYATTGATDKVTGIYQLNIATPAFFHISNDGTNPGKFYRDSGTAWVDKTAAISITTGANNLWSFSRFQDVLIGTSYNRDSAIEHDGGNTNLANVTNMPAGRFNATLVQRLFSFNTAAQPKLGYWCATNDRNTWDTTNDFLNFKASEADDEEISGVGEHLNSLIVGKESSVFRLYHTGTEPPFKYYKLTGNSGILSHYSIQKIPACGQYPERLIWIGRDNFYQLVGDTITSIADDIKPFWSEGAPFQINLNRLQYCTSGLIKEKNLYWCAFTSGSGSTHDYCFILDYKNMMWALCDFKCNCFGIRKISGREFLYSGNYTGTVCKHDPAVYNNLGAAYTSSFYSSWLDFGDTQLEKQIKYAIALFDAVGDYDLTMQYRTNLGVDTNTLTMVTGADLLGIDFILGTSVLGGVEVIERSSEINKRFKRIQILFQHSVLDEYFRLFAVGFLWKQMKGYRIE